MINTQASPPMRTRIQGVQLFTGGHRGLLGFTSGVLACALVTGGVAIAAEPSTTTGAFTACVNNTSAAVRIIDYQAGKRCSASEHTLNWSKGYRYRGGWLSTSTYSVLDVVTYAGSSYLAKTGSLNQTPATHPTQWGPLATRGATGPTGATGAAGANFTADTTLASGHTLTGQWSGWGAYGTGPGKIGDAVTYRLPLAVVPAASSAEYIAITFTTNCPGRGQALPGHLCVYLSGSGNATFNTIFAIDADGTLTLDRGAKDGFQMNFTTSSGAAYAYGTWAVTAP
jgi:hypothetical protein